MADIFLSHSSADNDTADQIKSWLQRDRKSWSVFLDKHSRDGILAGQGWQDRLRSELQSCRLVLAIITPAWLASRWCFTEAVTATFRGKDFVGVLTGDLPAGSLDVAPPIVHERQRQPLDLATGAGWEDLLHALDRSGLDPNKWFSIPEGVAPYPGFVAFEEKDAGVFFGRDQEITEYLEALNLLKGPNRAQALVISGGSGSGKSSLLKAGLIPRLRRQPGWLVVPPFDPSREPVQALFSALRAAAQVVGAEVDLTRRPPPTVEGITELLQDSIRAIEDKANAWLLLPLDQAEVLLASSQKDGETDASHLFTVVGRLLAGRTRKLVAALTIRTEFLPALERALPPEVRLQDRSLRSITALSEIIEKPAARFGVQLEAGLTGRLVEDAQGADGLPLLAYTLRELYDKYGGDNRLTVAEYQQLGGVEGAIEKKLHDALSDPVPTAEELAAFRRCFVRQLVRVDESAVEGERYLRTTVARDALPDAAVRLVERLGEARLLVVDDEGTIAIAHERLIRNWADVPLQTWLADDSDDRKLIDNLKSLLAVHRDGGPLLSEKPLIDAKDFLGRDPSLVNDEPELAEFIRESIRAEQRRQRREKWQFRGAIAASIVFLAVAIGAVWFYYKAQQQTRVAKEQRLVANQARTEAEERAREARYSTARTLSLLAKQTGSDYPLKGLQLSLDALAVNLDNGEPPSIEAENALRWTLANAGGRPYGGHDAAVAVAISPDDQWLATYTASAVQLWKDPILASGAAPLMLTDAAGPIRFSADGRWLITRSTSFDGLLLWNVSVADPASAGPDAIGRDEDETEIRMFEVGPNSRWLITSTSDDSGVSFRAWDLRADKPAATPIDLGPIADYWALYGGGVPYASFSGDGRWLVVGAWSPLANRGQTVDPRLWSLAGRNPFDGEPFVLTGHGSSVSSAVFSPDGAVLATSSNEYDTHTFRYDTSVRLWDLRSDNPEQDPRVLDRHVGPIEAIAFSSDSRWLVSARGSERRGRWSDSQGEGNDVGGVRIWDLQAEDPASDPIVLNGVDGAVVSVIVGRAPGYNDAQWLAVISGSTGMLWSLGQLTDTAHRGQYGSDPKTPVILRYADSGFPLDVRSVGASQDHRWLMTGTGDFSAYVWDLSEDDPTGRPRELRGHEGAVKSVAISQSVEFAVTGSEDQTARLWSLATGDTSVDPITLPGRQVRFSPNSRWLVSDYRDKGGSSDGTVRVWDLHRRDTLAFPHTLPLTSGPNDFLVSPDNRWLVASTYGPEIEVFDLTDFDAPPFKLHTGKRPFAIAVSDDSRWVAVGAFQGSIRLWDFRELADRNASPILLDGHTETISKLNFSPDHRWLVSVDSEKHTLLWDLTIGTAPSPLPVDGARPLAFSPGANWLATSDGTAVHLWDLTKPDSAAIDGGEHSDRITGVAFDRDERWLVTTARGSNVRVLALSGDPAPIELPISNVRAVAFSPDGRWLVTGDETHTLLWNASALGKSDEPVALDGALEIISGGGSLVVTKVTTDEGYEEYRLWDLAVPDPSVPVPSIVGVGEQLQLPKARAVSSDGRWLQSDGQVRNLRLDELQELAVWTIRGRTPREQ
jgi:WD40 repeat protein